MSGGPHQDGSSARYEFSGSADQVAQARDIYGGVHFTLNEGASTESPSPAMAPRLPPHFVDRVDLGAEVLKAITVAASQATPAPPVVLTGAGGFGKTKLATWACHQTEVQRLFPDGVMWVELGMRPGPEQLVATLIDLTTRLTGKTRLSYETVPVARDAFAGAIGDRRLLLVIDDAWRELDVEPFLNGGPHCVRLVTTRRPPVVAGHEVHVDAMTDHEALALLHHSLPEANNLQLVQILDRSGRWPLALSFLGGILRSMYERHAMPVADAVNALIAELDERGIVALDELAELNGGRAISTTLEMSLNELRSHDQGAFDRYISLAAFGLGESVPVALLQRLWQMSPIRTYAEFDHLLNRSLVVTAGADGVRLHDLIRDELRLRFPDKVRDVSRDLLKMSKPIHGWHMMQRQDELWPRLVGHLVQAGNLTELGELLRDSRFLLARLTQGGPLATEFDLRSYRTVNPDDKYATSLLTILQQEAHLLVKQREVSDLALTLYNRLFSRPQVFSELHHVDETLPEHALIALHPLPDLADPRIQRTLTSHSSKFGAPSLTWLPDGRLASVGHDDRTLRLRDMNSTKETALPIPSHIVTQAKLSPDGQHLALLGPGTVIVVKALTGSLAARWSMSNRENIWTSGPCDIAWSPDSTTLAVSKLNSTVELWKPFSTGQPQISKILKIDRPELNGSEQFSAVIWHPAAGLAYLSGNGRLLWWPNPNTYDHGNDWHLGLAREDVALPGMSWRPDGSLLAITLGNHLLLLRPAKREIFWQTRAAHLSNKLCWRPDGAVLATTHRNEGIGLWAIRSDTNNPVEYETFLNHTENRVVDLAWDSAGERLAVATSDSVIRVWRPHSDDCEAEFSPHEGADFVGISWQPDGERLSIIRGNGRVVAVCANAPTTIVWAAPAEPDHFGRELVWSSDGMFLIQASSGQIRDGETGDLIHESIEIPPRWLRRETAGWPIPHQLTKAKIDDSEMALADLERCYQQARQISSKIMVTDRIIAVSNDGSLAAVANPVGGLKIVGVKNFTVELDKIHRFQKACFLPDARHLVTVERLVLQTGPSSRVTLWDITTQNIVTTIQLKEIVYFLVADSTATYLAGISDHLISLLDAQTLTLLHQLPMNGKIRACAFDSTGARLAVVGPVGMYLFRVKRTRSTHARTS